MLVAYPEGLPLRDARRIYFDANEFGPDGGYDDGARAKELAAPSARGGHPDLTGNFGCRPLSDVERCGRWREQF